MSGAFMEILGRREGLSRPKTRSWSHQREKQRSQARCTVSSTHATSRCCVACSAAIERRSGNEAVAEQDERNTREGGAAPRVELADILKPVRKDAQRLEDDLREAVGADSPTLLAASEQIFGAGGKRLRPSLVLLVAHATMRLAGEQKAQEGLTWEHRTTAMVSEMLHTASLVHDDVIDEASTRRGAKTVHETHGNRVAILVGDYLFAQASWHLAEMGNLEVIKLISQIIKDFASGEVKQSGSLFDPSVSISDYIDKSFHKTATLIAGTCRSAAVFSGADEETKHRMFLFGRHLGLAFQIVDDILDVTQTEEQLGKPPGQDLASGNLTAPAIFTLQSSSELAELVDSEFREDGSLERALGLLHEEGGVRRARELAREHGDLAKQCVCSLPQTEFSDSLLWAVDYVLSRLG